MDITYQKLTEKELDTFIDIRIHQLREEGAAEDIDLKPALYDYYNRHMTDGTFVSWLALDGNRIVGTSACPLWKNRLISAVPVEKLACCPVCLRQKSIGGRELQGSCSQKL